MQAQSESQAFDFELIGSARGNGIFWGLGVLAVILFVGFFFWLKKRKKSDEKPPRITE